jgi:hypothetical protein
MGLFSLVPPHMSTEKRSRTWGDTFTDQNAWPPRKTQSRGSNYASSHVEDSMHILYPSVLASNNEATSGFVAWNNAAAQGHTEFLPSLTLPWEQQPHDDDQHQEASFGIHESQPALLNSIASPFSNAKAEFIVNDADSEGVPASQVEVCFGRVSTKPQTFE